jgi:DNA-binding transcriptional MerR regulator
MLRIGEAAKIFTTSNRTLRYWEEMGILKSTRAENDYRYYDDENAVRIKQIVLLRKLKMPIAKIEKLFLSSDFNVAIDTLSSHLASLKQDAAFFASLITAVEDIIQSIKNVQNLEQVFSYLEAENAKLDSRQIVIPQNQLSERVIIMSNRKLSNVRIVCLPAMTVASYRAESAAPENDCSTVFNRFVLENNLHKRDGYRYFGFNNPSPTEGNPVYGYEMWVTIPEDFDVPKPLVKKDFCGGLYASISTQMNEIGERWMLLHDWCEYSDEYDPDLTFQWLEECTMDFETFISEQVPFGSKQLDLLEPIKLNKKNAKC